MKNIFPVVMSLIIAQFNYAQTADSLDLTVNANEVVVTASKFAELRSNIAQQVQIITSRDLNRLNAQNSADALSASGQVFVQKSQMGGGSPVLRGFEASRVLLVVDGVRMNNIQYRSGHLQNAITVDNNILDRIEVLFGPSSTVYGSDALGGVVHFRTKNPTLATDSKMLRKGNAFFRYGSVNTELTGHLDFSIAGKKFGSLTSATFSKFGDMRQGSFTTPATAGFWDRNLYASRTNVYDSLGQVIGQKDTALTNKVPALQIGSGYHQYDLLQKFYFQQSADVSHTINIQFSNSSNIPRYDRLAVVSGSGLRDAEWYYGPQRRLLAVYDFNWKNAGPFDNVSIGVNYQNLEESRNNRGFGRTFRTNRTETINIAGFHADFKKAVKAHEVYFGLEGQFNDLKSTAFATDVNTDTTRPASTRYPDGRNKMNYIGVYANHSWTISPKLVISEGLRYNFINLVSTLTERSQAFFPLPYNRLSNNYNAVSGNLSIVGKPGAGFRIATMFSTGFRAPNVDDMSKIFESVPGSVVVPNSKLKPEYTLNADLTAEKTFGSNIRIGVTGFYTYFINAITADKAQFNGQDSIAFDGILSRVISLQNKNRAFVAGATAKAEADVAEWMSIYGSVTYTYGRIFTDTSLYPLDHIPPIFGKAGFRSRYKWLRGEFFVLFNGTKQKKDYNMLGEDNFDQSTPDGTPAWYTLNARVGVQPVRWLGIDLGCDNIMDYRYRHFASGFSAPGRNFFMKLSVNW